MTKLDATTLVSAYTTYSYTSKSSDEVYAAIGGCLNNNHSSDNKQTADKYYYSCALRLSIALSAFGENLARAKGVDNILTGDSSILGGKQHVIISCSNMEKYIKSEYDPIEHPAGDYTNESKLTFTIQGSLQVTKI